MDENLNKKYKEWCQKTEVYLKRSPEREAFKTTWGQEVARLYLPKDAEDNQGLGFPGEFPYTRGVQPAMYRSKIWTMRQYAGFGTPEESNRRFKYLLSQGQDALSVAFDLPTQLGFDSDDLHAAGEVGKVGVAIDSLADMELLFEGIPLDRVSTSMTINATAMVLLAMYIAVGEKQHVGWDRLRGTLQNDILKEYVARGTYIYPVRPSLRIVTDIFEFCSKEMPLWNPISISGYHIREAGADAVQEVAFMLGNAIEYVKTAVRAGLDPNVFGRRLSFFLAVHNDFLEEIAKFRAARRMWAKIMKERFHVSHPDAMKLRVHAQTAGSTLTAHQPENNIVRVAIQALAAIFGGTQSLHTNAYDEALALPTEKAATLALRTQQIIAHESGVTKTVDPLAGSYCIEALTDSIEMHALEYLGEIEAIGGMVKAIESGCIQQKIRQRAYVHQTQVEAGKQVIVGVNQFVEADGHPQTILKVDETIEHKQVQRLRSVKTGRDPKKVVTALRQLETVAKGEGNLMIPMIRAVKAYATVGEISSVLRKVFGEYEEWVAL